MTNPKVGSHELTRDDQVQGGQTSRKHGNSAYVNRGAISLPDVHRELFIDVVADLCSREGTNHQIRMQAADAGIRARLMETYILEEIRSGVPMAELGTVLKVWVSASNSALGWIRLVKEIAVEDDDPEYAAELKGIRDQLREGVGDDVETG